MKLFTHAIFPVLISFLISCNTSNKCYKNKRTLVMANRMGKLVDDNLKLKKGNYFIYYKSLVGLTKMEEYNGSYAVVNDTIVLHFCNNKPDELTGKGIFDRSGKSIILFTNTITDQAFIIRKDKR